MTEAQRTLNSYRAFLSQKLEPELRQSHEKLVSVQEKLHEYETFTKQVDQLCKTTPFISTSSSKNESDEENTTVRVDIGSEILCDAVVEDPSAIFVDVGLGFFCEMRPDEAVRHASRCILHLREKEFTLKQKEEEILEKIEVVSMGIVTLTSNSSAH